MSLKSRHRLMLKSGTKGSGVDWSKSVFVPDENLTVPDEYKLPSKYDPSEYKYICVMYYSSNMDYVMYSQHPFYAELASDGINHTVRLSNNNTTLVVQPTRGTYYLNRATRYTIDGVSYGGGDYEYYNRLTQTNYPIFEVDSSGNIIN